MSGVTPDAMKALTPDGDCPSGEIIKLIPRTNPKESAPYCWMSRRALEQIDRTLPVSQLRLARSVYLALCEVSSQRENSAAIKTSIGLIAKISGMSTRKAGEILRLLETKSKVIGIERHSTNCPRPNEESDYIILAIARGGGGHSVPTRGKHGVRRGVGTKSKRFRADFLNKPSSLPLGEREEEGINTNTKSGGAAPAAPEVAPRGAQARAPRQEEGAVGAAFRALRESPQPGKEAA